MSKHIIQVEEDEEGNLVLPFSEELLKEVGWKEGDTLSWQDNNDGSFSLTKKGAEMEWVLVECVSQFRERYMVQVPKGKAEYALDTVTMNEAKEFSQEHIGETIVSHRVISEADALELCDKDNDYTTEWTKETKLKNFFTYDGEKIEN